MVPLLANLASVDWGKWAQVIVTGGLGFAAYRVAAAQKDTAAAQRAIAADRLRLDMYHKRFAIYEAVVKLVWVVNEGPTEKYDEYYNNVATSAFESRFLFALEDGINPVIIKIINGCVKVRKHVEYQNYIESEGVEGDPIAQRKLEGLLEQAMKADECFVDLINELQLKMSPTLTLETCRGDEEWTVRS